MKARTLICTVVGLIAVMMLIAFSPTQTPTPKGIILPAKHVRAAISPNSVVIYSEPLQAKSLKLGKIRVELAYQNLNEQTKAIVLQKVKSLAASVGANGVIVDYVLTRDDIGRIVTLMGTAVYVPSAATRSAQS